METSMEASPVAEKTSNFLPQTEALCSQQMIQGPLLPIQA